MRRLDLRVFQGSAAIAAIALVAVLPALTSSGLVNVRPPFREMAAHTL